MTAAIHTPDAEALATQTLARWGKKPFALCLQVGGAGLFLGLVLGIFSGGMLRVTLAYLLSILFFLAISLGSLFFVAVQHLVRAGWSVVVRRITEIMACGVVPLAILFVPIILAVLVGSRIPFIWNDAELVAKNELLQIKSPYLNSWFFTIRALLYFGIWFLIIRKLFGLSLEQDRTGEPSLTNRMEAFSAPALILFALTITFAAFDWIMTLDPFWYSTIYGVYYFAGGVMSSMAVLALIVYFLQQQKILGNEINVEHRHDIAKLMFGFICFWAYIAMSQYLLIWYANIPEETIWFQSRQNGGWQWVSMALILGHFVLPFLGFISRNMKRNAAVHVFWALFMLVMEWIDLYWLIYPNFIGENQFSSPPLPYVEIPMLIGVGGIWLAGLLYFAGNRPLLPIRDPRLGESLAFHNI